MIVIVGTAQFVPDMFLQPPLGLVVLPTAFEGTLVSCEWFGLCHEGDRMLLCGAKMAERRVQPFCTRHVAAADLINQSPTRHSELVNDLFNACQSTVLFLSLSVPQRQSLPPMSYSPLATIELS